jgi:hypothetical protein
VTPIDGYWHKHTARLNARPSAIRLTAACQITPAHRLQWHKHLPQVLRSIVRFRSDSEDLKPIDSVMSPMQM